MSQAIDVPLNTAIAELDESLRTVLDRELGRHGFDGVDISFDAPSREWSGKLTVPTVDLFLYDLREAGDRATSSPQPQRGGRAPSMVAPPLRLALTYAVTAWTKAVEDEHRLLSQVLAILFSHKRLPEDVFDAGRAGTQAPVETAVARPREDKSDFWNAIGGQYKVSIDYVVQLTVDSGASFTRGPEVRTRTIHLRSSDGPRSTMEEFHGLGGTVRDAGGAPLAHAWVVMPDTGAWAATDTGGRFRIDRIRPGTHRMLVRTPGGEETAATVSVPGAAVNVVIGARKARAGRRRT
jgi:hypothetical protein